MEEGKAFYKIDQYVYRRFMKPSSVTKHKTSLTSCNKSSTELWHHHHHHNPCGSQPSSWRPLSLALCYSHLHFFKCWFIFERDLRQSASGEGAEGEGHTESEAGSRPRAVSIEPHTRLEPTNYEIMTWAEVRCSTDWVAQAPLTRAFYPFPHHTRVILVTPKYWHACSPLLSLGYKRLCNFCLEHSFFLGGSLTLCKISCSLSIPIERPTATWVSLKANPLALKKPSDHCKTE